MLFYKVITKLCEISWSTAAVAARKEAIRNKGGFAIKRSANMRLEIAFRLASAIGVPVVALFFCELILRLVGFGQPTDFLLLYRNGQQRMWVENQRFSWRFFPISMARYPAPFCVDAAKQANSVRILVLGESAAQGDPLPAFSFARVLDRLLRFRFPDSLIEVVNAAFTAINSHVIRYIAQDCKALNADVWIIYIGNNEVVGPYGAGTVLGLPGAPGWLVKLSQAAICTRVGQAVAELVRLAGKREASVWHGMEMFTGHYVTLDSPKLQRVYQRFEKNLIDIVKAGKAAGAHVLLCTVAVNLKDCAPFGSSHKADLSPDLVKRFERLLMEALEAYRAEDWHRTIEMCDRLLQIDDGYAAVYYLRGRAWGMTGRFDRAKEDLTKACDLDSLRFRADSSINQIIRRVATRFDVPLIDVAEAFSRLDPWGVPGDAWFVDHVHFNFDGNYRLAKILAEALLDRLEGVLSKGGKDKGIWPDVETCKELLGYGPLYELTMLNFIWERMQRPPYTMQVDYTLRMQQLSAKMRKLEWASKLEGKRQALRRVEQAIELFRDDWRLHEMRARLATALMDWSLAEQAWLEVARLIPHSALPWKELGRGLLERRRPREAADAYRKGLEREPWNPELLEGLGVALWECGSRHEAQRFLKAAVRLDPTLNQAARLLEERQR